MFFQVFRTLIVVQMSSKFEFLYLTEFSLVMIESIELIFLRIRVFLPKYLQKVAGTLYGQGL